MSPRPLPAHGTYARANGSPGRRAGCNCQPCIKERRRVGKRNHVNRQLGRPGTVNATPARTHLQRLHEYMGWKTLAKRTTLDYRTLVQIYRGERATIRRTTASKILAVPVADSRDAGKYIDATGSIRRVRALQAAGHTTQAIADACQTGRAKIELIVNAKQATVREMLAAKIRRAYSQLAEQPGDGVRARNRAKREGWAPPAAWDDDTIDDPQAQPDLGDRVLNFHERAALRREEIIHLAWCGHEPEQIRARLNDEVSISTVRQIVQDWRTGAKRQRRAQTEPAAAETALAA